MLQTLRNKKDFLSFILNKVQLSMQLLRICVHLTESKPNSCEMLRQQNSVNNYTKLIFQKVLLYYTNS